MIWSELQQERAARWHINGEPISTAEDAQKFLDACGLCLMFPRRGMLLPTWIGACSGSDERLPEPRQAFADPRTATARELALRLAHQKRAFRWPLGDNQVLISPEVFPFFYALAADQEGRQQPMWAAGARLSKLASDAWSIVHRDRQPVAEAALRERLGGAVSAAALDRSLHELWARLRIHPIGETDANVAWESLARWAPQAIAEGAELSQGGALSALISKYLECAIAAELQEMENTFSFLASRARMREAVNALLAARELAWTNVGQQTMLQPAPAQRNEARSLVTAFHPPTATGAGKKAMTPTPTPEKRARPIVAIDGPAGAGKSTIALRLAQKLGYLNIETGAMYRALALRALETGMPLDDAAQLAALAQESRIELDASAGPNRVLLDGRDVSERIREADVTAAASRVSVHPQVRAWMVARQREIGARGGIVMEGRDVGTVVFPDAEVKIFLDAAPEVRAERRIIQQSETNPGDEHKSADAIAAEMKERDRRDVTRAISPLAPAADAIRIDSSRMSIAEVVGRIEELLKGRL